MARYEITHSCGHIEDHQIYGTNVHGERERKAEWLSGRLCSACYQAQKEQDARQREDDNAAAATENAEMGLVALSGSDKQILWAEAIRKTARTALSGIVKADRADVVFALLNLPTTASWWIDHRRNESDAPSWIRTFERDFEPEVRAIAGK